jgi:hypothetical protein
VASHVDRNAATRREGVESSVDAERCTRVRGFVRMPLVHGGIVESATHSAMDASRGEWVPAKVSGDRRGRAVTRRCL